MWYMFIRYCWIPDVSKYRISSPTLVFNNFPWANESKCCICGTAMPKNFLIASNTRRLKILDIRSIPSIECAFWENESKVLCMCFCNAKNGWVSQTTGVAKNICWEELLPHPGHEQRQVMSFNIVTPQMTINFKCEFFKDARCCSHYSLFWFCFYLNPSNSEPHPSPSLTLIVLG